MTFIATHKNTTYILELAREGSTKINASAMPADRAEADRPIQFKSVPLCIRRAARVQLIDLPARRRAFGTNV